MAGTPNNSNPDTKVDFVDTITDDDWNNLAATANSNYNHQSVSSGNPHSVTKGDVGLGSVENTALSTWTGSTSITTLGTIGTGTWQGDAIASAYIGSHSHTEGDITDLGNYIPYDSEGELVGLLIGGASDSRRTSGEGLELHGSTSSFLMCVQDGNGRVQMKWNATRGVSETYLVSSEAAALLEINPATSTEVFNVKYAAGDVAGNPISWTTLFEVGSAGIVLQNGARINEFSTDNTLAGNSNVVVPTEAAVKGYVDTGLATKSDTGHTHDDRYYTETELLTTGVLDTRYYTESEVDTALAGKSDTSHNHTVDSLSNVTITSKATDDILKWSGSAWVNVPIPTGGSASPELKPYSNLTSIALDGSDGNSTSKKAVLLFHDDYTSTNYADNDIPIGWHYSARTTTVDGTNNYMKIVSGSYLEIKSTADNTETTFQLPYPITSPCMVEIEFYYDDLGVADRCTFNFVGLIRDADDVNDSTTVKEASVLYFMAEHNQYYYYDQISSSYISTGWGNPESFGWHTLRFFLNPNNRGGTHPNYGAMRIEISTASKTAVMDDVRTINNTVDTWHGLTRIDITPTLSTGWDILFRIKSIKIYARDNEDIYM